MKRSAHVRLFPGALGRVLAVKLQNCWICKRKAGAAPGATWANGTGTILELQKFSSFPIFFPFLASLYPQNSENQATANGRQWRCDEAFCCRKVGRTCEECGAGDGARAVGKSLIGVQRMCRHGGFLPADCGPGGERSSLSASRWRSSRGESAVRGLRFRPGKGRNAGAAL